MLQLVLPVCGVSQTSFDICNRQFREVFDNFIVVHSRSKPAQYVINGYPCVPDTWFPKSFVRVSSDYVSIFYHGSIICLAKIKLKRPCCITAFLFEEKIFQKGRQELKCGNWKM